MIVVDTAPLVLAVNGWTRVGTVGVTTLDRKAVQYGLSGDVMRRNHVVGVVNSVGEVRTVIVIQVARQDRGEHDEIARIRIRRPATLEAAQ